MTFSMTGFASQTGESETASWVFETKSVNGKGLDVRLHLPQGCEALEQPIRSLFKSSLTRGNIQTSLNLKEIGESGSLKIDTVLLSNLSRRARMLDRLNKVRIGTKAADLLAIRGVIQTEKTALKVEPDSALGKAILETVRTAISQLIAARETEGKAISTVLGRIVLDMATEVRKAKDTADAQPAMMHARLMDRSAALLEDNRVNADRLEQEVALLVTKADVTEELDRLNAHFEEAGRLLAASKPVGRKLEFLSQELLREANTLGSKAASIEMTRHSLALKTLIDQFKEQAANVE